jgi:hypothetical protein
LRGLLGLLAALLILRYGRDDCDTADGQNRGGE